MSEQFAFAHGYNASPAEQRSWERSLAVLSNDLHDAGLDEVEMLLEYQLPLTSRRIDALLCGVHPRTGDTSYVVVELKQWSRARPVDGTDDVVLDDGRGRRLHPAAQVGGYCEYLADFNAALAGTSDRLTGVAYLHNATDDGIAGLWDFPQERTSRMFTGQRRGEFMGFLAQVLSAQSGANAADELLNAAIKPSKQLLALAAEEIQEREQFTLIDDQRVAYSTVMRAVQRAKGATTKEVVIVTGGPGSGKSVIALSLLGELSRQGRTALHATGSSAFTQTMRKVAGRRAPRVKGLFKYYNQFIDAEKNGIDVLINDEAHRVKETSTNRYTPAHVRTGRPQVEELIDAARVPVSSSTSTRWCGRGSEATCTRSHRRPKPWGARSSGSISTTSSGAEAVVCTRSGCFVCSAWNPVDPCRGMVTTPLTLQWPTLRRSWRAVSTRACSRATPAGSRPGTAGTGASPRSTSCSPTCRSATGNVRGTTPRTARWGRRQVARSGRRTRPVSIKSGASTQPKASSTTTAG